MQRRIDEPLYPTGAVREALANAFCHREYVWGTGAVSVGIYDDRLEVTSSGTLHFGLTPPALFEPHESQPWNPLIASVMYRRGIIEQWGRGTLKMSELTQAAGLPRPEIEVIAGAVVVRFRPTQYIAPSRITRDISALQQRILTLLASAPTGLAFRELSDHLGAEVRRWTLNEQLRALRQLELVEPRGDGRGSRWFLLPQSHVRDER